MFDVDSFKVSYSDSSHSFTDSWLTVLTVFENSRLNFHVVSSFTFKSFLLTVIASFLKTTKVLYTKPLLQQMK